MLSLSLRQHYCKFSTRVVDEIAISFADAFTLKKIKKQQARILLKTRAISEDVSNYRCES